MAKDKDAVATIPGSLRKTELVSDFENDSPIQEPAAARSAVAENRPITTADMLPAPVPAKTAIANEPWPWGFLVKHPGYGALRVRRTEANNEAEAVEFYRKKKCPHVKSEVLGDSGLRCSVLKFTPAETEIGKV